MRQHDRPGGLPLVVAVTGHRDIHVTDIPQLKTQVAALLTELQADFPHTPLRMLNALAEGADRVAAEVALSMGISLVVPLPLPLAEYEKDFPESRAAFHELLDAAAAQDPAQIFTLPLAPGNTADGIAEPGGQRDLQFEQLGAYLVRHAHVLLALWDGEASDKPGGTGHTVHCQLQGSSALFSPEHCPLDLPDQGPVYQIRTRRRHSLQTTSGAAATKAGGWLYPAGHDVSARLKMFRFIDDFNQRGAALDAAAVAGSRAYVLPPEQALSTEQDRILDAYARADQLAQHYRRLTHRFVIGILLLAGGMTLAFETYAHLIVKRPVLVIYLLCFLAIAGLYRWNRKLFAKTRYLDYRALAEGLRVQLFWRLSGIEENVVFHYLKKQTGELQWIREALRGASLIPPQGEPQHELVENCWIRDQGEYFSRAAKRDHHKMERLELLANGLYGLGLAVSVAVVVFWGFLENHLGLHHVLIVVMGFLPVAAALWMAFAEKVALREQSKQYNRMAIVYQRAIHHIDAMRRKDSSACGDACLDALALAVGKEALAENGDWVLLHRERPIEIPKGG